MNPASTASQHGHRPQGQRGLTLIGLLFWAVVICTIGLIALKVLPSMNEYFTIQRAVNKIATNNPGTVAEVRRAFESQQIIEYSISSISAKDLEITKENERVVIKFGYDKEIELIDPVFLVIKYRGRSQ